MILTEDKRTGLIRGALGAILGGAVFAILTIVGRAPEEKARLTAQSQAMASLKTLSRPTPVSPYSVAAVCRLGLASEATVLKARLSNAAAAAGVNLSEFSLTASPTSDGQRLSALQVKLTGDGPYLATLAFLRIVADGDPTLFVNHLRIRRSAGGRAGLSLEGQVYCNLGDGP